MLEFLRDISSDEFNKNYFDQKSFASHGPTTDFPKNPAFSINTLEDALKYYENPVMVVGEPIIDYTEGISNKTLVTASDALDWYEKGCAVELDHFEIFYPNLSKFIKELKIELNLPTGCIGKAIVYAAKNGGGFPPHFDAYTNFIFQLKGEKKWTLLENDNISLPLEHYELLEYPYISGNLKHYWNDDVIPPDIDLSDGKEIVLKEGSFLYLARGDWHKTSSEEETLALNITFTLPKKVDIITEYLKQKLSSEEILRESIKTSDLKSLQNQNTKDLILQIVRDAIDTLDISDVQELSSLNTDIYQATQSTFRSLLKDVYQKEKI